MQKILFLSIIVLGLTTSCNTGSNQKQLQNDAINIFSDANIRLIAQAQYSRKTSDLMPFLNSENPEYREAAAKAFASVQDPAALVNLANLLTDEKPSVRIAAAYSIGQIGNNEGAQILFAQFLKENNDLVKKSFLEATGKCGDQKLLKKITALKPDFEHEDIWAGKALALARYSIRGMIDSSALNAVFEILASKEISEIVKYYASIALTRSKKAINTEQFKVLKNLYNHTGLIDTKMNLVLGAGNNLSDSSLFFLQNVFQSADDYRLRINSLRALAFFDYPKVRKTFFSALNDENVNVAIYASEYLTYNGIAQDVPLYLQYAEKSANFRVKADLLLAANKYATNKDKSKINEQIIKHYQSSNNNYEKAWLLKALGGSKDSWQFIENEIFNTDVPVIRSVGMDAMASVYEQIDKNNRKLQQKFAEIFKKATLSGDVALISVASGILRNPEFGFKNLIKDYGFLNTAAANCQLPRELEAYLELQKTIVYFADSGSVEMPEIKYKKPDWDTIALISPTQKIMIHTSKGDIKIQLDVENNPVTVYTFIELIKSNFYKNLHIHRVVPNFVIQDGCPRGDGWGSPDFSIRSEFYNSYYETGSLGMASAGKDTESSQWFITHSPTPHLDGRYTMFGKVIHGMEVVHKIEVGDEIFNIELVNE